MATILEMAATVGMEIFWNASGLWNIPDDV